MNYLYFICLNFVTKPFVSTHGYFKGPINGNGFCNTESLECCLGRTLDCNKTKNYLHWPHLKSARFLLIVYARGCPVKVLEILIKPRCRPCNRLMNRMHKASISKINCLIKLNMHVIVIVIVRIIITTIMVLP